MAYEIRDSQAGRPKAAASVSDDALPNSEDLSNAAAAGASEAKAAASSLGDTATRSAERARTSAAEGLDGAASAVHADGERVASAAHRAGEALASGAQYVREREVADMVDDLVDVVRNNPGPALFCAAALGFVIGRTIYRN